MEKRIKELETLLMQECEKHEKDCTTCPYTKECDEYARLKNLIISWSVRRHIENILYAFYSVHEALKIINKHIYIELL